jgi:hypothetical protein
MQSSSRGLQWIARDNEVFEVALPITLAHDRTDFDLFWLLRLIVTGVFSSPSDIPDWPGELWKHNVIGKCFPHAPTPASLIAMLTFSATVRGSRAAVNRHNSPKPDLLDLLPCGALPCSVFPL